MSSSSLDSAVSFANGISELAKHLRSAHSEDAPDYQPFGTHLDSLTPAGVLRQVHYLAHLTRPASNAGARSMLEVGSGYGFNLLTLAHLGFPLCHGIEIVPSICSLSRQVLEAAPRFIDTDISRCQVFHGNAEQCPFADGAYDGVIAVEVISHTPSLDRLLRELNRVLGAGGVLLVGDGNNVGAPVYKRTLLKQWEEVRQRELPLRVAFIRETFPHVNPQDAASLALHTELHSKEAMLTLVARAIEDGQLPMALYVRGNAPVYFQSGIWDEFPFYPPELASSLGGYGFDASVRAYLGGARGGLYALAETAVNHLPDRLRFAFRPSFLCYAQKVGAPTYLVDL